MDNDSPIEFQRAAGIGSEDGEIFVGIGVEKFEDVFARAFNRCVAASDVGLDECGLP